MYLWIYIATHLHMLYLDRLQAVLESNSRCAWRWQSTELRDTVGGGDCVNLVMHLGAVMERLSTCIWRLKSSWTQRCSWRPWSSEFGDAFGGRDRVTQRCTSRLWSSEFEDALGGRASFEMQLEPEIVQHRDALGGRETASMEMHLNAEIK